jgi:mRNA interferase RelE/StbE
MFLVEHKIYKLKDFDIAVNVLDIKKLKWSKNLRRLRVWKYRILFEKYDDKLIILVIDIWSRGDIYK